MYEIKKGVTRVQEGDTVDVRFEILDYSGNTSIAGFKLVGTAPVEVEREPLSRSHYFVKADGSLNNRIEIENFQVNMEKYTMFRDTWMYTSTSDPKGCCSRCYQFGEPTQSVFKTSRSASSLTRNGPATPNSISPISKMMVRFPLWEASSAPTVMWRPLRVP